MEPFQHHSRESYKEINHHPDSHKEIDHHHSIVEAIEHNLEQGKRNHRDAASYFWCRYLALAIPALVFTSLVPLAESTLPHLTIPLMEDQLSARKVVVTVLSVTATIFVGLNNMLHYESIRDSHVHAEKQYHTLHKMFERDVRIPCLLDSSKENQANMAKKFLATMEEFLADEPPLPKFIEDDNPEWGFENFASGA